SWVELGTGRSTEDVRNEPHDFIDSTRALTRTGSVRFRMPATVSAHTLAGMHGHWIRARLIAGGYGEEPDHVLPPADGGAGAMPPQRPMPPPSLASLEIAYSLGGECTTTRPDVVLGYNDFVLANGTRQTRELGGSFELFRPSGGQR